MSWALGLGCEGERAIEMPVEASELTPDERKQMQAAVEGRLAMLAELTTHGDETSKVAREKMDVLASAATKLAL